MAFAVHFYVVFLTGILTGIEILLFLYLFMLSAGPVYKFAISQRIAWPPFASIFVTGTDPLTHLVTKDISVKNVKTSSTDSSTYEVLFISELRSSLNWVQSYLIRSTFIKTVQFWMPF